MSNASVASRVRGRVLRSSDHFWRPDDFDGSPAAVAQALSRLARAGEVRRLRRGLYWRGTSTALGMAPPPQDRFVNKVMDAPGTGPAGWSASLALGLSTQVPRYETIAVPGRAPRNSGPVRFVSRVASAKRRDERLRPHEVALLEVLRDWSTLVEVPTNAAVERITDLARSGTVRLDRVVRASATEPPRVRERLRQLLGTMGRPADAEAVRPARSESVRGDLALAASAPTFSGWKANSRVRGHETHVRSREMTGWTAQLPDDERLDFVEAVCRMADVCTETGDVQPLAQLLDGWRATAAIHSDPTVAALLSVEHAGPPVRVKRPRSS